MYIRVFVVFICLVLGLCLWVGMQEGSCKKLLWNVSESVEPGLYWHSAAGEEGLVRGALHAVEPPPMALARGCALPGQLLLKRVVGLPGDEVCMERSSRALRVRGEVVSTLAAQTSGGEELVPAWWGCRVVAPEHVALATAHPRSCDVRVLGFVKRERVLGRATLVVGWGTGREEVGLVTGREEVAR